MMYRCSRDTLTVAFLLLSAAFPLICGQTVRGTEGQTVTLPCSYNIRRSSDITTMCWGRGSCPNSKCNDVLIWTDGYRVTERSSDRYQLNDNIAGGKISLTISQTSMSDAGIYCCRIEHHGWFNDEKINIRLNMEKAPTTIPPTTARKTTPPPTRARTTTTTTMTVQPTTLQPTLEVITTPPPIPATTTATVSTEEETIETTTMPTATRTATPEPTPTRSTEARATTEPSLPQSTESLTTTTYTTPTESQPLSTDPYTICEFSHEMLDPYEAFDHHRPKNTPPSQSGSHSNENGISDLLTVNVTTVEKKESGTSLYIITAICVSVIVLVVVSLLILKVRGKQRGRYPLGLDPNLELVNHAEAPASEIEVEISQTVTLEVDKADKTKD